MGVGIGLILWDAVVTEGGKVALHTINVIVALIFSFGGGFVIDPGWAGQFIQSVAVAAGDFFHAKADGTAEPPKF